MMGKGAIAVVDQQAVIAEIGDHQIREPVLIPVSGGYPHRVAIIRRLATLRSHRAS